jgi:hypothetical protein
MRQIISRSKICLARIMVSGSDEIKFCGKPSTYNDLCRGHDRRMVNATKFNQYIETGY